MGLTKAPQKGSDFGDERKSSMEKENNSRYLNKDAGPSDSQDTRVI
jgi:hypothetical protein